jgi:tetratricopeptide (TPR) repeat protein
LQTTGQRIGDLPALERATTAFEEALRVYRREEFPLDWAMIQHNIGNTLHLMGGLSADAARHGEAVAAFRLALLEHRRERVPMQWANSMASMGAALQSLFTPDNLRASIEARRAALEVLSIDNAPLEWASAMNGIGTCLINLSTLEGDVSRLAEAAAAFEEAKKVFTREDQPVQWAFVENSIGDVHWNRATFGGGQEDEFRQALDRFRNAQQALGEAGHFAAVMLLEQKINLIRKAMEEQ